MTISERDFRGVDLNLLVAFLVLMRERSVSRAAEQLYLGQPAVSGALARLRSLFDDELLVRTAGGMEPTVRALQLEASLLPALQSVQAALFQPAGFDPARAERTFTLAMPDWVEIWLMPRVFAELRRQAPGMRIAVKATDPFQGAAMLERHEMELGIATLRAEPGWMRSQPLARMGFSCVHHAAQLRFDGGLSLPDYIAHPHLLVTYRGAFQSGIDQLLAEQGLRRRVQYTTQQFSALPSLLREVPALATVPAALADCWAASQDLRAHALPLQTPDFGLAMFWHAVKDRDPALQWLRGLIAGAAARRPA